MYVYAATLKCNFWVYPGQLFVECAKFLLFAQCEFCIPADDHNIWFCTFPCALQVVGFLLPSIADGVYWCCWGAVRDNVEAYIDSYE